MTTMKLNLSGQTGLDFIRAMERETEANVQGWRLNYIGSDAYSAKFMVSVDACDMGHSVYLKADGTWALEAVVTVKA